MIYIINLLCLCVSQVCSLKFQKSFLSSVYWSFKSLSYCLLSGVLTVFYIVCTLKFYQSFLSLLIKVLTFIYSLQLHMYPLWHFFGLKDSISMKLKPYIYGMDPSQFRTWGTCKHMQISTSPIPDVFRLVPCMKRSTLITIVMAITCSYVK